MTPLSEKIGRLCALRNRGVKFGIDRMRLLADALNNPQNAFPCAHVAGTNGKGSTCAMLESIFRALGFRRVGLYTSPHLVKLGERIQVNRVPMNEEEICNEADKIFAVAARFGNPGDVDYPSFFEVMTAMAFRRYAQEKCDAVVLEVGLGGRLDATNIVTPRVSAISSIGFDHTEILGSTLTQIAREKAGIIKPNVPVALGFLPDEAETEIRKIARERGAPVFCVRDFFPNKNSLPKTNLAGAHQQKNAALALLTAKIFIDGTASPAPRKNKNSDASGADGNAKFFDVSAEKTASQNEKIFDETAARKALLNVVWRARWEKIRLGDGRELVVDVTHNEEGARVADAALSALFSETGKRPRIVTGVLGMDRARPLIRVFAKHARELIFVRPAQERACSFAELESCVPANFSGTWREARVEELFPGKNRCAIATPDGEPLVVIGSCYLAGEVLAALAGTHTDSALQDNLGSRR